MDNKGIYIAFYKVYGNPRATWLDYMIAIFSFGSYSHVELLLNNNNLAFSSSGRDGCVRFKNIDRKDPSFLDRWDVIKITGDSIENVIYAETLSKANKMLGKKYDYLGALLSIFRMPKSFNRNEYFCSELVVEILKDYEEFAYLDEPHTYTPTRLRKDILRHLKE